MADDLKPEGSPEKDPKDWTTGDAPMTGAQASYISTLAQQLGVEVELDMTKAHASEKIEELKQQLGGKA